MRCLDRLAGRLWPPDLGGRLAEPTPKSSREGATVGVAQQERDLAHAQTPGEVAFRQIGTQCVQQRLVSRALRGELPLKRSLAHCKFLCHGFDRRFAARELARQNAAYVAGRLTCAAALVH